MTRTYRGIAWKKRRVELLPHAKLSLKKLAKTKRSLKMTGRLAECQERHTRGAIICTPALPTEPGR